MFFGTAALFVLALVLGGLGPHEPLLVALIEAAAFPLLIAAVLFGRTDALARPPAVFAILVLLLMMALGTLQLLPLPASVWRGLPGRDVPAIVAEVVGQATLARPLSIAPETTRLVIQSWLPPIAIFVASTVATADERRWLARLVVAAAALSGLLGLAQMSFGDGTLIPFIGEFVGRYPGLFANYNHQAVFLAAAVALLPAAVPARGSHRARFAAWWPAVFWIVALLGVLVTSSRAGLALFALASAITGARMIGPEARARLAKGGLRRVAVLAVVAVAVVIVAWLTVGYRGELMSSRFENVAADGRYEFWTTSLVAIRSHFPWGAGFGTFESAYQLVETLEQIQPYLVNHAHNDYLEIVLEAGIGGIVLLALFVLWFAARLVGLARHRERRDPLALSGALVIVLVMLHSIVDYPLRTEAIGCLFAFACAALIDPPAMRRARAGEALA